MLVLLLALQRLHSSLQVADELLCDRRVPGAGRPLGAGIARGQQPCAHMLQVLMAVRDQRADRAAGSLCTVSTAAADAICRGC